MNTIKFRAWDKTSKSMIKDYAHSGAYGELYTANFHSSAYGTKSPDLILLQFTGLLDKNGIEIYEDDILTNYHSDIQVVEYVGCQWQAKLIKRGTSFWPAQYLHCEYMGWEIIGNKFQNPGLLNGVPA